MAGHTPDISVIILTKNGGDVFQETLRSVLAQRIEGTFEVLVIDSTSSDGTAEAAERLFADPEANTQGIPNRVARIPAHEFGHGRTRNLGCRVAEGALVLFLSQDATPIGATWLRTFVQPFADPRITAAFCRQVARPEARLPERFILEAAYPPRSSLRTRASLKQRDAGYILFSNAASAIRRQALIALPFNENLMMCEDTHWAVAALRDGHAIAYVAEAQVAHSHHYSLHAILARNFDFAVSLAGLPGSVGPRSYLRYLRQELRYVVREGSIWDLPWMVEFEFARISGFMLGSQQRRLPARVCRRISAYPHWFDSRSRLSGVIG